MRLSVYAAALGLCLISGAAWADPALETRQVPAENVFPYLKNYYGLPAGERDLFHPQYALAPASRATVHLVLKRPGGDVPLVAGADGALSPTPSPADMAAKLSVEVSAPKDTKVGIGIWLMASVESAKTYDARRLRASVDQARNGVKKLAGLMALAVPNYQVLCFEGATSGSATLADGRTVAMKTFGRNGVMRPCYAPVDVPNATQITLDRATSGVFINPK